MERVEATKRTLESQTHKVQKKLSEIDTEIVELHKKIDKLRKKPANEKNLSKLDILNKQLEAAEIAKNKIKNIATQKILGKKNLSEVSANRNNHHPQIAKQVNLNQDKIFLSKLEDATQAFFIASKEQDVSAMKVAEADALKAVKGLKNINVTDENNVTPLQLACTAHMLEVIKFLLNKGADFTPVPFIALIKKNGDQIPLFCQFMKDKELVEPILLKLSSVWNQHGYQNLIKEQFSQSMESLDYESLKLLNDNLSNISQNQNIDASIPDLLISLLELAIWAKGPMEEDISPIDRVISQISSDLDVGSLQEFKNYINSKPPPDDLDIRNVLAELKNKLKEQPEPLSPAWKSLKNTIAMCDSVSKSTRELFGDGIPSYKNLQAAFYIVNEVFTKNYKTMNCIINPSEELPFSLLVDKAGVNILPFNFQDIQHELKMGVTTSLKEILCKKPPYNPHFIQRLQFELTNLFNTQNESIPPHLQSFNSIYAAVPKSKKLSGIAKALMDTINIAEYNNKMNRPSNLSPDALLITLSIINASESLNRNNLSELRTLLISVEPKNAGFLVDEFKKILANEKRPLGDGWQHLENIVNSYDKASELPDYQRLQNALQIEFIKYAIQEIKTGTDNDSAGKFLEYIQTNPPLSKEELDYLIDGIKQFPKEGQNKSLQLITNAVAQYEKLINKGENASVDLLSRSFGITRISMAIDTFTSNLSENSEREIVTKLRDSLKYDPPITPEELVYIIKNIKKKLSKEPIPLHAQFINNIFLRHEQISKVRVEEGGGITSYENLLLAIFIEYEIKTVGNETNVLFKEAIGHLPRDVHLDENKNITIWAKHNVSILRDEGSCKRIFSAIKVPFDDIKAQAERVVIANTKFPGDEVSIKAVRDEASITNKLKGIKGIIQIYSVLDFEEASGARNIGHMLPEYGGSLGKLYSKSKPDVPRQIDMAKQLLYSINEMHKLNIMHWDLKLDNLLHDKEKVIIADFGMAFEPGVGEPFTPTYGSPLYAAPELVYRNFFNFDIKDPDSCKRAEVMSLGLMLYKLHFNEEFPYPCNALHKNMEYEEFEKLYKEKVEEPLDKLLKKENRTAEDDYKILIYKMVRLQPNDRISTQEALSELSSEKYSDISERSS